MKILDFFQFSIMLKMFSHTVVLTGFFECERELNDTILKRYNYRMIAHMIKVTCAIIDNSSSPLLRIIKDYSTWRAFDDGYRDRSTE